jgi:hypothetical protein
MGHSATGWFGTGRSLSGPPDGRLRHAGRCRQGKSRQDRWAWTVSWMSMNRIDQYPGRGSGNSCRDHKIPVNVTTATASQVITPTARTHGVAPIDITMMPARAMPTRRTPLAGPRQPSASVRCIEAPAARPCHTFYNRCATRVTGPPDRSAIPAPQNLRDAVLVGWLKRHMATGRYPPPSR